MPEARGPQARGMRVYISGKSRMAMLQLLYVPLCVGGSKGKAGIHLTYYPESRDTFEMYPGKVMHMIGG